VLDKLLASPVFAAIGIAVVVAIVVTPLVLRLAGLTSDQIVTVIQATWQALALIIQELRDENKKPPS